MTDNIKGAMLTLFGAACWGLSGTMGQYLFTQQQMDSRWLVPIRLGAAGVLMLFYCFKKYGKKTLEPWNTRENAIRMVIYGLIGVSGCQFFYFTTIQLASAAIGTILQDLAPIFVMAYTCLAARRMPRALEVLSVVCALSGVFLLTTHGQLGNMAVSGAALITGVLAGLCVAIYNLAPGKLMEQFPISIMQAWAFIMGGIAFSLLFRIWTIPYVPNAMGLFGIAFVVIVGNIMAFMCYITGVKYVGPQRAVLYSFAEPVTAALLSFGLLGTPFTLWDAAGFGLIFIMMILCSRL